MSEHEFKIPQAELDKISEYVFKGIASSKRTESNMMGDINIQLAHIHENLKNHGETLIDIKNRIEIQNGKVFSLIKWRSWSTGVVTTILVLGGTIVGLSMWIYNNDINSLRRDVDRILVTNK